MDEIRKMMEEYEIQKMIKECEKSINDSQKVDEDIMDNLCEVNKQINNPYHHSSIYIIRSNNIDKIYIGSTTLTIDQRLKTHENDNQWYQNDKYHYVTSVDVINFGDCYHQMYP